MQARFPAPFVDMDRAASIYHVASCRWKYHAQQSLVSYPNYVVNVDIFFICVGEGDHPSRLGASALLALG